MSTYKNHRRNDNAQNKTQVGTRVLSGRPSHGFNRRGQVSEAVDVAGR